MPRTNIRDPSLEQLEKLRARGASLLDRVTDPTIEITEAPRTPRQRRLDPQTEFQSYAGKVRLVEAEPFEFDPNSSQFFRRSEIRRVLGHKTPEGVIALPVRKPFHQALGRRLKMLGGRIGQLRRTEDFGMPIFSSLYSQMALEREREARRRRLAVRTLRASPGFPYVEIHPGASPRATGSTILSSTRSL